MHRLNPRLLLPLLLLAGILASCEEVQEAGEYDNWQARNTAFIDSLNRISTTIVATEEDARMVQPGQMFRILDDYTSTSTTNRYIYCRKLTANDEGKRPMATSTISNFMYGTLINGEGVLRQLHGLQRTGPEHSPASTRVELAHRLRLARRKPHERVHIRRILAIAIHARGRAVDDLHSLGLGLRFKRQRDERTGILHADLRCHSGRGEGLNPYNGTCRRATDNGRKALSKPLRHALFPPLHASAGHRPRQAMP